MGSDPMIPSSSEHSRSRLTGGHFCSKVPDITE